MSSSGTFIIGKQLAQNTLGWNVQNYLGFYFQHTFCVFTGSLWCNVSLWWANYRKCFSDFSILQWAYLYFILNEHDWRSTVTHLSVIEEKITTHYYIRPHPESWFGVKLLLYCFLTISQVHPLINWADGNKKKKRTELNIVSLCWILLTASTSRLGSILQLMCGVECEKSSRPLLNNQIFTKFPSSWYLWSSINITGTNECWFEHLI